MDPNIGFSVFFANLLEMNQFTQEAIKNNLLIIKTLKSLLNEDEDLMNLFISIEGHSSLLSLFFNLYESYNNNAQFLNEVAITLLELTVGKNNIDDIVNCITKKNPEEIPKFDSKRNKFLQILQSLLIKAEPVEDNSVIFECLYNFLQKPENMKIFLSKEINGIAFILDIVQNLKSLSTNLYNQMISLFETCIVEFK